MTRVRIPLAEAEEVARDFCREIDPVCERLDIVGSIRRRSYTVSDIDVLVVPSRTRDLFGEPLDSRLDDAIRSMPLLCDGDRYKRILYRGYHVCLFVTTHAQYGYLQMVRTGPPHFARMSVTPASRSGWLRNGLVCRDGGVYEIQSNRQLCLPTEEDFFAQCLTIPYVPPEERARMRGVIIWAASE